MPTMKNQALSPLKFYNGLQQSKPQFYAYKSQMVVLKNK